MEDEENRKNRIQTKQIQIENVTKTKMNNYTRPHLHKFQQSPRHRRIFLGRAMTTLLVESMSKGMAAQACSDQPGVSALDIEKLTSDVDEHIHTEITPLYWTTTALDIYNNIGKQSTTTIKTKLHIQSAICRKFMSTKIPEKKLPIECSRHIHTKITHHCTELLKALEIQRKTIHSQN